MSNNIYPLTEAQRAGLTYAAFKFIRRHNLSNVYVGRLPVYIMLTFYLSNLKASCVPAEKYQNHKLFETWRRVVARVLQNDTYKRVAVIDLASYYWKVYNKSE